MENRKMFGEKNKENVQLYWYRSFAQKFLSYFIIFTSFNTTPLILLVKIILM